MGGDACPGNTTTRLALRSNSAASSSTVRVELEENSSRQRLTLGDVLHKLGDLPGGQGFPAGITQPVFAYAWLARTIRARV